MILLALLAMALFLISVRESQRLRWQLRTRSQLEKALSQGDISPSKAKEIISHSQKYGLDPQELASEPFSLSQEREWTEREIAQQGWHKLTTLLLGAALITGAITIILVVVSLLQHGQALLVIIPKLILVVVATIVLTALLLVIWVKIIYPLIQMFRY